MADDAPTLAEFRTFLPELTAQVFDDATVQRWLPIGGRFHARTKPGWMYATAHLMVMERDETPPALDGGGGVVRSEMVGPLQRHFSNMARDESEAFWARSTYGRFLLEIERRSAVHVSARVYE